MLYIYLSFIAIVCIFGIVEILELVLKVMMTAEKKRNSNKVGFIIIPVSGHREDIEYMVRGILFEESWKDELSSYHIILVDSGLDAETREICALLSKEHDSISICAPQEMESLLERKICAAR